MSCFSLIETMDRDYRASVLSNVRFSYIHYPGTVFHNSCKFIKKNIKTRCEAIEKVLMWENNTIHESTTFIRIANHTGLDYCRCSYLLQDSYYKSDSFASSDPKGKCMLLFTSKWDKCEQSKCNIHSNSGFVYNDNCFSHCWPSILSQSINIFWPQNGVF